MRSLQRRLALLEAVIAPARIPEYPLLTTAEINDIAERYQSGQRLTKLELCRLERQSPIIEGELLMTCHDGNVFAKRYVGIDVATAL